MSAESGEPPKVSEFDVQQMVERRMAREVEKTWPMVEGFLVVQAGRWGPFRNLQVGGLMAEAFLSGEDPTQEELDRIAKALTKTLRREYRKVWERIITEKETAGARAHYERLAREHSGSRDGAT